MKTLFVSDLDGTLLNKDSLISSYSISHLNKMIDEGLLFTVATARSVLGTKRVVGNLKLNLPLIVSNGVKIADFNTNELLYSNYFSFEDVELMKKISMKYDNYPIVYQTKNNIDKFYYIDYNISVGKRYYLDCRINDPRIEKVNSIDELFPNNTFYFTFIDTFEALKPIYEEAKKYFTCIFQKEIYRDEYWLEVIPNNCNKGIALKKLKELLNVDEIIYFGDSLNDVCAFKEANISCAVKNALEEVKKYATNIILNNDNDGVCKFIEKYIYDKNNIND